MSSLKSTSLVNKPSEGRSERESEVILKIQSFKNLTPIDNISSKYSMSIASKMTQASDRSSVIALREKLKSEKNKPATDLAVDSLLSFKEDDQRVDEFQTSLSSDTYKEEVKETISLASSRKGTRDAASLKTCTCPPAVCERQSSCLINEVEDELMNVTPEPSPSVSSEKIEFKPIAAIKSKLIMPDKTPKYQKTTVLIKPEATEFKDVITRAIEKEGLDILVERCLRLSPEQVSEIYSENYGSYYFPMFVKSMSENPIWLLVIAGTDAIRRWKRLTENEETLPSKWFFPYSIRKRFGLHEDVKKAILSPSNSESANKELRYFFPLDIIEPIYIKSGEVQDYCDRYINPILLKVLYVIAEERPVDPVKFLAKWLLTNNPNQPHFLNSQIDFLPLPS